jgi:hypothetical protein
MEEAGSFEMLTLYHTTQHHKSQKTVIFNIKNKRKIYFLSALW